MFANLKCIRCNGRGMNGFNRCEACNGGGTVVVATPVRKCAACNGKGFGIVVGGGMQNCTACKGCGYSGRVG